MNNTETSVFTTPKKISSRGGTFFKNKVQRKERKACKTSVSKSSFYGTYYKYWIQGYLDGFISEEELREQERVLNVKIEVFKEPKLYKLIKQPWKLGGKVTKTNIIGLVNGYPITTEFQYTPVVGPDTVKGKSGDPQKYMNFE